MKITFIRPNMMSGEPGDAMEPLVFAILASLTPESDEVVFHDELIEEIPFDDPTDLVAMTVDAFTAKRAYQISEKYRSRQIPVVMGGFHPTLCAKEAIRFADSIVVGDAEGVWPGLLRDAKAGSLKKIYKSKNPPIAGLKPDRTIFKGKRYARIRLIQFGRGCRHKCEFCSIQAFYGNVLRQRPVPEVIDEIEQGDGKAHIFFTDDNLFTDRKTFGQLLGALKPLGVRWSCQASLDAAASPGLVEQMAKSGCTSATIGFESLNPENLKQMGKGWNLSCGSYGNLVRVFHNNGIMVYGTFVFGYDGDTVDSIRESVDFAIREKLFLANFNPLVPTPGTPLYERLKSEQRLINDPWWLHPAHRYGQSVFHPKGMSAEQLAQGCYRAKTDFNKAGSIAHRALNLRANLRSPYNAGVFLAANWVSRREIHRKQGQTLGAGETESPGLGMQ